MSESEETNEFCIVNFDDGIENLCAEFAVMDRQLSQERSRSIKPHVFLRQMLEQEEYLHHQLPARFLSDVVEAELIQ